MLHVDTTMMLTWNTVPTAPSANFLFLTWWYCSDSSVPIISRGSPNSTNSLPPDGQNMRLVSYKVGLSCKLHQKAFRSKNDVVHINVTPGKHYWRQWRISSWKDLVPVVSGKQVENKTVPHNVLLPRHPGRGYQTWWTFYRGNTFVKKHCFVLMIFWK